MDTNASMTSYLERAPGESSKTQVAIDAEREPEDLTMGLLKEILLQEISKVTVELGSL